MKTARRAQAVSIISGFIYPLLAIPAILVGVVAKSAGNFHNVIQLFNFSDGYWSIILFFQIGRTVQNLDKI